MGAFLQGAVQGYQAERKLQQEREQIQSHTDLYSAQAKHLNAQTKQMESLAQLMPSLFQQGPEMPGPGAPMPTGVQPGTGYTLEELQQPTGAGYATTQDALNNLYQRRSPAYFQEGPRPQSAAPIESILGPMSPQGLEAYKALFMAAPQEAYKGLLDRAMGGKKDFINLGPGHEAVDPLTGQRIKGPPKERQPQIKEIQSGDDIILQGIDLPTGDVLWEHKMPARKLASERTFTQPIDSKAATESVKKGYGKLTYAELLDKDPQLADQVEMEVREQRPVKISAAAEMAKPVEVSVQDKFNTLQNNLYILDELKSFWSGLTPQEKNKYVGVVNFPMERVNQFIQQQRKDKQADPKFARFATLVFQAKNLAFQTGGKQLTPFEASVVFGYTPTGTEMSVADFEAKLEQSDVNTNRMLELVASTATTPRKDLPKMVEKNKPATGKQPSRREKVFEDEYQKTMKELQSGQYQPGR